MKLNKKISLEAMIIIVFLLASLHYYLDNDLTMLKGTLGFIFCYIVYLFISRK